MSVTIYEIPELNIIAYLCKHSHTGKRLPDALYVHIWAIQHLDCLLQKYENRARSVVTLEKDVIVKFSTNKRKISYLLYPGFDYVPHPVLKQSIQVDLESLSFTIRDYSSSKNPPIIHRKETFVTPEYPLYDLFAQLTYAQEAMGLLENSNHIGTQQGWQKRLQLYNVSLQGHSLILNPASSAMLKQTTAFNENSNSLVERHKAAISRNDLSRPIRIALEYGLFTPETTFFDYGCGYGEDVARIAKQGYPSLGWDPYYSPNTQIIASDIVNLGYVINVIENTNERQEALEQAWKLTLKVLIVAAQVTIADTNKDTIAYADGVITRRNTFQKYYEQEELKNYIDQTLGVDAIPVALGIYFVFRDEAQAQVFRANRFHSRITTPKINSSVKRFEDYQNLLAPLMSFFTERGRLPNKNELPQAADINAEFGSLKRAFQVILLATNPQEWEIISQKRRQDLLVYLALYQFSDRPKLGALSGEIKEDILSLFGTYKQACYQANEILHSLSKQEVIAECCQNSQIGRKLPNSLYIHISALQYLDPLLRIYEGCASRTIGCLDEANVIKLHTKSPKISYLFYPNFDQEPHPVLQTSMEIDLRNLRVTYRDYHTEDNPPLLHHKEALVNQEYPLYQKFAKLTRQEEDWGLLEDWRSISHRTGWLKCLDDHYAMIKGYQLFWQQDADPYKLKLLRSAVKSRQSKRRSDE